MTECGNLSGCKFFQEYENNFSRRMALRGFARLYCQGGRQDTCMRKLISKKCGGPRAVPTNMMPNGMPLAGTSKDHWPDPVWEVLETQNIPLLRRSYR